MAQIKSGGPARKASAKAAPAKTARAKTAPARTARAVAARVVHRVMTDNAFLSDTLDAELSHTHLELRDRALATELSYGVVRLHRSLSERLEALAKRGVAKGDELAQAHLWVAAYQLLVLDRIPAFAAINEAVKALRNLRGPRVANFANAILRKLSQQPKLERAAAYGASVPAWLYEQLVDSVGKQEALALLGASGDESESASGGASHRGLCVRLTAKYAAEHPEALSWLSGAVPGKLAPGALWLPPTGDLRKLSGFPQGWFVGQEEGAQWSALALGARPGERVLDACAGHGQKSSLLAEKLGQEGQLWVSDVRGAKLKQLCTEFQKLGLNAPTCQVVDWLGPEVELPSEMDRVLVDVPCTGTGTLRRRPEIGLRLSPDDPVRLGKQSTAILKQAALCARPGGRVLYVVCSVLRAECEAVVEAVADVLTPVAFDAPEAVALVGTDQTQVRLLPGQHGTDGYFIASFVRK